MIGPPLPRPTDWSPLAPFAPLPAEPETTAAAAARLRTAARDMQSQIARLREIAADGTLVGAYADKLRSESGDLADRLAKTVGRYEEVATSLDEWWPQLTVFQNSTISLLRRAQATAALRASQPDAADTELRSAQAQLARTLEEAEDAGALVARKVRDAIRDSVKDGQSGGELYAALRYGWALDDDGSALVVSAVFDDLAYMHKSLADIDAFARCISFVPVEEVR